MPPRSQAEKAAKVQSKIQKAHKSANKAADKVDKLKKKLAKRSSKEVFEKTKAQLEKARGKLDKYRDKLLKWGEAEDSMPAGDDPELGQLETRMTFEGDLVGEQEVELELINKKQLKAFRKAAKAEAKAAKSAQKQAIAQREYDMTSARDLLNAPEEAPPGVDPPAYTKEMRTAYRKQLAGEKKALAKAVKQAKRDVAQAKNALKEAEPIWEGRESARSTQLQKLAEPLAPMQGFEGEGGTELMEVRVRLPGAVKRPFTAKTQEIV